MTSSPREKHPNECLCKACQLPTRDKHPRSCTCRPCIGRRNRRKGLEAQRRARKTAGVTAQFHGQLANEENWRIGGLAELFAIEQKSGLQVPKKLLAAFAQAETARALGDPRPVLTIWSPAGTTTDYACLRLEDLVSVLGSQGPENVQAIRSLCRNLRSLADQIEKAAQ